MSVIILNVDEVTRTLSNDGQYPFVVKDKTVDIVRFALNTGFTDVVLDENTALRVMYQRPGESQVRAQTLTYYDTDGLHNYYDWQLSQSDLTKDGSLMVALCILRTDGDVEEWHTTPCVVRVLSTIHTDDSDEGDETITPTVAERVAILESMIQRVASGAPIVVASTSAMTDTDKIYVLSTDGKWYYYDGSAWVAGGEYGAVETDTTLTQSGVPADAKAVGDALANAFTGESLLDGESMKFVLSSKYDDFKMVDGYGYFDAKLLLNSFFDLSGRVLVSGSRNKVFRIPPNAGRSVLAVKTVLGEIFSPDFPITEIEWAGLSTWFNALGDMTEGYWISRYPTSGYIYFTVPNSAYGESATIGDFVSGYLDGSIGIKMDSARIREYDPSEVISAITSGGNPSAVTVDGETVYKGFITWTWSDVFDFENTTANNYRMYSTFGLTGEITEYAKDCVWFERTTRLWYRVRADAVSERTFAAVKDYLLNTKHLKFYYVSDEEVTA